MITLTEPDKHTAIHGLVNWLPWHLVAQAPDAVTVERLHVAWPPVAPGPYRLAVALTRAREDVTPLIRIGTDLPLADGWMVLGTLQVLP